MHDFDHKSTDRSSKSDNDKYNSNKKAHKKKTNKHMFS